MNSTYDTLFALLRAALHGGDIPKVGNFSELLREARKQTVDGLLYALPEISVRDSERPALLQWIAGMPRLEQVNREMEMHASRLSALLEKHDVRHAIMKGQTCAAYYPQPLLRRSGDIDVYIVPDDFQKACRALESLNFEKEEVLMQHSSYRKGSLFVELHWVMQHFQWIPTHRRLLTIFNEEIAPQLNSQYTMQIAGRKIYVLPPEMNIVLLTAHPLMHIVNTGIGLRQVIDWMMVLKGTREKINTAKLYDQLNQLHLLRAFRMLAYLCCTYLGMDEETACISSDGKAYNKQDGKRGERALKWIMQTGNFGHAMQFDDDSTDARRHFYFLINFFRFFSLNPTEMMAWPWMKLYRFVAGQKHLYDD